MKILTDTAYAALQAATAKAAVESFKHSFFPLVFIALPVVVLVAYYLGRREGKMEEIRFQKQMAAADTDHCLPLPEHFRGILGAGR